MGDWTTIIKRKFFKTIFRTELNRLVSISTGTLKMRDMKIQVKTNNTTQENMYYVDGVVRISH